MTRLPTLSIGRFRPKILINNGDFFPEKLLQFNQFGKIHLSIRMNAAALNKNIIIVINDNEMSIAENHGGLYTALRILRDTNGQSENNWFKAMGFHYQYVANGNNITDLIAAFQQAKDTPFPTVIHIHTIKGKGYSFAEQDKKSWHWNVPFDLKTGKEKFDMSGESYQSLTAEHLTERIKQDPSIVVVNAGTPGAVGFGPAERAQLKTTASHKLKWPKC